MNNIDKHLNNIKSVYSMFMNMKPNSYSFQEWLQKGIDEDIINIKDLLKLKMLIK